jgi:hypothetical protein
MAGKTVNVQITEYFPGYQCSINNMDWSPAVMFDAATPFSDVRKNYFPIEITADGWFPVVDELGAPLGIQIQPVPGNITYEALLRIEVVADASFGVTGTLEIEFERPGYYNSLRLSPFVNLPISLTQIRAEGMLSLGTTPPIFQGDMLIDRPVSIRFTGPDTPGNSAPIYVRRLYLDFYQPNYELKEHLINPADQARQAALANLQTALPFSDRAIEGAVPISLVGAQYEMGLRDIAAERYNPAGSAVFVSGPFHLDGMPEIIRLDADITGSVDCYLICRPAGIPVTTDRVVQQFVPGTAISFPDVWAAGALTSADFYLKWVFHSDDAVLTRFLLQVTQVGVAETLPLSPPAPITPPVLMVGPAGPAGPPGPPGLVGPTALPAPPAPPDNSGPLEPFVTMEMNAVGGQVYFVNKTGLSTSILHVGDEWQLVITGGPANSPLLLLTSNTTYPPPYETVGTTDTDGNITLSGTITWDLVGTRIYQPYYMQFSSAAYPGYQDPNAPAGLRNVLIALVCYNVVA